MTGHLFQVLEWELDALCAQTDPDLFFPSKGEHSDAARRICTTCPVQAQCLTRALNLEGTSNVAYRHGIWAGTTPEERAALAKSRRAA